MHEQIYHTAILGAGASGLMCAGSFAHPKIVIEHNKAPGAKIDISGGGKCNFTNKYAAAVNYLSQNKHFCKGALSAFPPARFVSLLEAAFIRWQEKEDGQLFAFKAKEITDFLYKRAKENNSEFLFNVQLLSVEKEQNFFAITTSAGIIKAYNVVVATGGLSFPALGASNFGIKTARNFGLRVVEQRPALAGLKFDKPLIKRFMALAGNSIEARISTGRFQAAGSMLFTHEGISGPPVLQTSLFWQPQDPVILTFLPNTDWAGLLREYKNSSLRLSAVLAKKLPMKLAQALLAGKDRDISNASKEEITQAVELLTHFSFIPTGTSGYTKAEVTSGGVDTRDLDASTMQARNCPGLFFTGEAIDVTGMLGGFNLQWAWSSGFVAAKALEGL